MADPAVKLTKLADAYLLGEFYDYEPDSYPEGETRFLADVRRDYPEHVDAGERVARRVLDALKDEGEAE